MKVSSAGRSLNWNASGQDRLAQNAANLMMIGYYENAYERTMGNKVMDVPGTSEKRIYAEVHRNFSTFMPETQVQNVRLITQERQEPQLEVEVTYGK